MFAGKRNRVDDRSKSSFSSSPRQKKATTSSNGSSGSAKILNQEFIERKKVQYHYELQPINEQLLRDFQQAVAKQSGTKIDEDDVIQNERLKNTGHATLIAEYNRVMENIRDLFGRPTGDVIAMGQDDAFQLGQVEFLKFVSDDGDEEKEPCYPPLYVKELRRHFIQVAAGGMHSVALSNDGHVYSWGCFDDGPLGRLPANYDISGFSDRDQCIPGIVKGFQTSSHSLCSSGDTNGKNEDGQIVAIATGDTHSLFLSFSGNVYMSGMYKDCDSGKFADPRPKDDPTQDPVQKEDEDDKKKREAKNEPPPEPPHHLEVPRTTPVHCWQLPDKIVKIACGHSFNAAISKEGKLYTWGMGHCGELARSADMTSFNKAADKGEEYDLGMKFTKQPGTRDYRHDMIGEKFLKPLPPRWAGDTNDAKSTGSGGISTLFGSPMASPLNNPKRIVTNVACGGFHILVAAQTIGTGTGGVATPSHGQLYSSGLNNYGQLGHGDTVKRHELTLVKHLQRVNIYKLAAGEHHSLALDICGHYLHAFGRSDYGQLGLYDKQTSAGSMVTTPEIVPFPKKNSKAGETTEYDFCRIIDIDAGDRTSLAVTSPNNEVYVWGFNETGATGHPSLGEGMDVQRPTKLCKNNETGNYTLLDDSSAANMTIVQKVLNVSGGGQHTLMITQNFQKN